MTTNQDEPLVRLAGLVRDLRRLQRRLLAGDHSAEVVRKATALESQVDREVSAVLDVRQGELFEGPTGSGPYGRER